MGKMSRNKGRRGQREAISLLRDRGFHVEELNSGKASGDLVAIGELGTAWIVEVKNTKQINVPQFTKQAMRQAGSKPWMLLCKLHGYSAWLVLRKNEMPEVWHARVGVTEDATNA